MLSLTTLTWKRPVSLSPRAI